MEALLQVIAGLVMLVLGGEALVRGAVAVAKNFGVPTLVIGLTIVSFGTSAPEMFISVQSVLSEHYEIALGNIIGSNIANILLVLGVTAIIYPIAVDAKLVKRDAPLMLMATCLFLWFCMTSQILGRFEALIFLFIVIAYTIHVFRSVQSGDEQEMLKELEEETDIEMPTWKSIVFILAGCSVLVFGSKILVVGASILAANIGVPEAVIGLTVLAIGSSAPELVTAVVAARRQHADLALGNIVGSNLFNITVIGGVAGLVSPIPVAPIFLETEIWIMLMVTVTLIAFMLSGRRISKSEGIILFTGYICYNVWQYYSNLVVPA